MEGGGQRGARDFRVHALGAVSQGIISEGAAKTQFRADRRVGQPFQPQETGEAQDMADHDCPDHLPRGDAGMGPAITRSLEVRFQAQAVAGVVLNVLYVRSLQRGCCLRRSTSNSALAVRTSRRAS